MILDPVILLYALAGYVLGSLSTAIITCKLMRLPDPRSAGSKNPGATNVLRLGGKKAAIITLLGDMLKGLLPVIVVQQMTADPYTLAATGLAAFLGHLFPLFFGFKGGKGVATFYGALLGFHWLSGLLALLVWLLTAWLTKISSLSALVSAASASLILWALGQDPALLSACMLMALLLFWRHRSNIRNLINGSEGRIGQNKSSSATQNNTE